MSPEPDFTPDPAILARLEFLSDVRNICESGSWATAARKLSEGLEQPEQFTSEDAGEKYVETYFRDLLFQDELLLASALAWDRGMFEPRAMHVQRIFKALFDHDLNVMIGAVGLGKSYCPSAWAILKWIDDPNHMTVKFASVNDTNLRGNLWANFWSLRQGVLFPIADNVSDQKMRLWTEGGSPDSGFQALLLSASLESKGKAKSFHPKPFRKSTDKNFSKYGNSTQIFLLLDEGQHLSEALKKDLGSPKGSVGAHRCMKICITANPTDETKWALKAAEPRQGWREDLMDKLYDWESVEGWHVTRLDSDVTENVVQRKVVFPGFPEYGAHKKYLANSSEPTSDYFWAWRGWPPSGRAIEVVVAGAWFDAAVAEPIFTGHVHMVVGVDPGFVNDKGCMAIGRYGVATGYIDQDGKEWKFASRKSTGDAENRHCLVVDQLIHLISKDPALMGDEVKRWCVEQGVAPDFCSIDIGGPGYGTVTHLQSNWGPIIPMNYREAATEMKILAEDRHGACHQSDKRAGEVYLTIRRWIEPRVRAFFINPLMQHRDALKKQLTSRQKVVASENRFGVEGKKQFLLHEDHSPDEADAVSQMPFVVRMRGLPLPAVTDEAVQDTGKIKRRSNQGGGIDDRTAPDSGGLIGVPEGGG